MYDFWMGFVIALLIALIPAKIASSKGRNFVIWYLYGVLLWIVAFVHSLLLSDHSGIQCPCCKKWIKQDASVCKYCHAVIADYYNDDSSKTKDKEE